MRIVTLMENTPGAAGCRYAHGLSLYIETHAHRILADTGPDDGFLANARRLGIDLAAVDMVFLSHGHYDHADGLPYLAQVAPRADIYMQRSAVMDFFALEEPAPRYIGMRRDIPSLPNLRFLDGDHTVDEDVAVLAGFTGRRRWSRSNLALKVRVGAVYEQDSFVHEQALVIREAPPTSFKKPFTFISPPPLPWCPVRFSPPCVRWSQRGPCRRR